jgi:hypothetical protein
MHTDADADAFSKNDYLHMRMWIMILRYANDVINCIRILFVYNIYFYIINSQKQHCLCLIPK